MRVAVVGAGWAGIAAAVRLTQAGASVSVYEMAPQAGGRARSLVLKTASDSALELDNGQHILIGAYASTLEMMRTVGVSPQHVLRRLPLSLPYPDGSGFGIPAWAKAWASPWNALAAILANADWTVRDKWSLMRTISRWRADGFVCAPDASVSAVCNGVAQKVMTDLIDPLCVSALNLQADKASGEIFLRVMHDAMLGRGSGGYAASDLLIPSVSLGKLLPEPGRRWLLQQGSAMALSAQVMCLERDRNAKAPWLLHVRQGGTVHSATFDRVVWATNASAAARVMHESAVAADDEALHHCLAQWAVSAAALRHTAIGTVYVSVEASAPTLRCPMVALPASGGPLKSPAQFVFDRSTSEASPLASLAPSSHMWAIVASDCQLDTAQLTRACIDQVKRSIPGAKGLQHLKTVIEKRATFACSPGVHRPSQRIASGLYAAGDYVHGPYPATLEGAVLSGEAAARACFCDD